MAETLKEVLISKGFSDQQLEEAMTMGEGRDGEAF